MNESEECRECITEHNTRLTRRLAARTIVKIACHSFWIMSWHNIMIRLLIVFFESEKNDMARFEKNAYENTQLINK